MTRRGVTGAALLLGTVLFVGCASSAYMREVEPTKQTIVDQERATVVFARPSGLGTAVVFQILDADEGRFLGESLASSLFAVAVPPGEHVFVIWDTGESGRDMGVAGAVGGAVGALAASDADDGPTVAALRADLAAGRTYFVKVEQAFRGARLLAVQRDGDEWEEVPEWLAEETHYVPEEESGQAHVDANRPFYTALLARGRRKLASYDDGDLRARTLRQEDGR